MPFASSTISKHLFLVLSFSKIFQARLITVGEIKINITFSTELKPCLYLQMQFVSVQHHPGFYQGERELTAVKK